MESKMTNLSSLHPAQNPAINWDSMYGYLPHLVTKWVYSAKVATWLNKDDIVDEIVQEAIVRSLGRMQRGNSGELPPIRSIQPICITIAHHCFIDMIRHDQRLWPIGDETPEHSQHNLFSAAEEGESFADIAAENVFTASLFEIVVAEAIKFPPKLRTALFIDLACRMSFKDEPTPLQQAFLRAGVALEMYRHQVPSDPVMRSRHAALVSLAYKRIRELASVQEYIAAR